MNHDWSKCTIIIACFNEQDNIIKCIEGVNEVVPGAEILVVAGGTDKTAENARTMQNKIPTVKVIENKPDYGKGHATKVAILNAKNDYQAEIDADLQFSPSDLPSILIPIMSGEYKIVNGTRHLKKTGWTKNAKNFARDYGNRYLAFLASILTGTKFTDMTAGFHAWERNFVKSVWVNADSFSFSLELLIRAAGTGEKILEIPISYSERTAGESMHKNSFQVIRAGIKMTKVILKTWYEVFVQKNVRAKSFPSTHSRNTPYHTL